MFNLLTKRSTDVEVTQTTEEKLLQKLTEFNEYDKRFPEPTQEEYDTLPLVIGTAPFSVYFICLMEFAERASYYGVQMILANFIQLPLPRGGNGAGATASGTEDNAGALGMGLQAASGLTMTLTFLAYLAPLFGGYISDKSWGRVKTIWFGVWLGAISHIILVIAAIPSVISHGKAAVVPLVFGIITLAVASGMIKPNLLPLLLDQYEHKRDIVREEDGKRVIVSREQTLERMTLIFYWCINAGSLLSIGTGYAAKRNGFWLAFLIPSIVYLVMIPIFMILNRGLKKEVPTGFSLLEEAGKVLCWAYKGGFVKRIKQNTFWEWPKPSNIIARGEVESLEELKQNGKKKITWSDQFVDDLRVTIDACKIFLFFVVYNINDGGIGSIQNSQSISLTNNGVPNTILNNFNPLTIIVVIPILNFILYPSFRKLGITYRPVHRIFTGFMLAAISQAAGAIIQWKIYETSPCGYYATDCTVGTGVSPINIWVEAVLYILQATSECFANTASYEIAYTRSPENMKGLVMALLLFMQSLSAAISIACTSALFDPYLIWPFVACAVAGSLLAIWFVIKYRKLHIVMENERIEKEEKMKFSSIEQVSADDSSREVELVSEKNDSLKK